jgi:hypothetical protein
MLVLVKRISGALCLMALTTAPVFGAGRNQQTADAVAAALRSSQTLSRCAIQIETRDGLVVLTGAVTSPALKADAIARTRSVAGVSAIVDRLRIAGDGRVTQAQYLPGAAQEGMISEGPIGAGGAISQPPQISYGGPRGTGAAIYDGAPMGGGTVVSDAVADSGPVAEGPAEAVGRQGAMAGTLNYAGSAGAGTTATYPTTYPWQAWANTSPPYPNPEIPYGWRVVTLRWDDGLWWLDFKKHYGRPFFTPYPFGIWAY